MISFRTKTVENVLAPVASQIARLLDANDKMTTNQEAVPDLTDSIMAVSEAVDNLIRVGKATCRQIADDIMRLTLSSALHEVHRGFQSLQSVGILLTFDPFSLKYRTELAKSAECILQGTSTVLMCVDEWEVSLIVTACCEVVEKLRLANSIADADSLLHFARATSPIMTKLLKMVGKRATDLTDRSNAKILYAALDTLTSLFPALLSSTKKLIDLSNDKSFDYFQTSDKINGLVQRISCEIDRISLTVQSTSKEGLNFGRMMEASQLTRACLSSIEKLMPIAEKWLLKVDDNFDNAGENATWQILQGAERIACRVKTNEASVVRKLCQEVELLLKLLLQNKRLSRKPDSLSVIDLSNRLRVLLISLIEFLRKALNCSGKMESLPVASSSYDAYEPSCSSAFNSTDPALLDDKELPAKVHFDDGHGKTFKGNAPARSTISVLNLPSQCDTQLKRNGSVATTKGKTVFPNRLWTVKNISESSLAISALNDAAQTKPSIRRSTKPKRSASLPGPLKKTSDYLFLSNLGEFEVDPIRQPLRSQSTFGSDRELAVIHRLVLELDCLSKAMTKS